MYPNLNFYYFQIPAYTLFMYFALITVLIGSYQFLQKRNFIIKDIIIMLAGMSIFAIIGARILNIIVNFSWYQQDYSRVYSISTKGFSLFGGILSAMLVGLFLSYYRKISITKFADTVIPFVGIGIAIMRIGCFLNGCCFGKETNSIFAVKFPESSPAHIHQITQNPLSGLQIASIHPTQLYEMTGAIIGTIVAFYLIKKKSKNGIPFLAFGIWFTFIRLINLYFRILPNQEQYYFYAGLYIILIFVGLATAFQINRITKST